MALFLGLRDRLGRKLGAGERIVAFVLEYAAYLMNRLRQGEDGKVAYERMKDMKPTIVAVEFWGERSWDQNSENKCLVVLWDFCGHVEEEQRTAGGHPRRACEFEVSEEDPIREEVE